MNGFRFKPQHPISKFIADFYCHKAKLAVEVDGDSHLSKEQKEYDEGRDYEFERFEIKTLRFTNAQVKNEIQFVLDEIRKSLPRTFPPLTMKGVNATAHRALFPSGTQGERKQNKSF